ncbi:MAG: hypothetical protein AB2705_18080 [Candidatus Thiodiazotropha sp.]
MLVYPVVAVDNNRASFPGSGSIRVFVIPAQAGIQTYREIGN